MASTRSRPRGREHARPSAGGVAAEHATKIYTVAIVGIVVIVAFLALTSIGHVIDAATQHFMLYYAGVFALITLCASVGLGLVATDRMFMSPGHRVMIQSAHRAASFGAVAFLIIHIATEVLAQRVHVLDAVVPFLSPFRTFYIGLGTIASDLILLLLITGILRGRFNAGGKAWRWRAIHYTSYLAFVFGVWHGLLGGRAGKPYVDWSYGFVVAFVLLGLAVRVLSNSLRPKESLSAPPVDMAANSASAPLRAAAMLAQYGGTRVGRTSILGGGTGAQPVLSAPVTATVLTALPAGGGATDQAQPYYEPGYEGPPRYLGAPRSTDTGPMPRAGTGPMPRMNSGPMPRAGTGPMPRAHRAYAKARDRPAAAVGQRADAAGGFRADASRHRADASRHRAHAPIYWGYASGHRGHAPIYRGHAPSRDWSHAALGDRAAAGAPRSAAVLDGAHATGRDRAAATGRRRLGAGTAIPARARTDPRRPRSRRPCSRRRAAARWDRTAAASDRADGHGDRPAPAARARADAAVRARHAALRLPGPGPGRATRPPELAGAPELAGGRLQRRLVSRGAAVGFRLPGDRPEPQVPGAWAWHARLPGLP